MLTFEAKVREVTKLPITNAKRENCVEFEGLSEHLHFLLEKLEIVCMAVK